MNTLDPVPLQRAYGVRPELLPSGSQSPEGAMQQVQLSVEYTKYIKILQNIPKHSTIFDECLNAKRCQ